MKDKILLNFFQNVVVPNCPFYIVDAKLSTGQCLGARLSAFSILVTSCLISLLGAKLSVCLLGAKLFAFAILVLHCLILLSFCQNVCFYDLDAKLSVEKLS